MKIFVLLFAFIALVSSAVAAKDPVCDLPHSFNGGRDTVCGAFIRAWTFKSDTNECVEFTYYGCEGNKNNFNNLSECEKKCR